MIHLFNINEKTKASLGQWHVGFLQNIPLEMSYTSSIVFVFRNNLQSSFEIAISCLAMLLINFHVLFTTIACSYMEPNLELDRG